jgi:phosphatidylglycerol---prolipoprotein diacylglyceryl transferase
VLVVVRLVFWGVLMAVPVAYPLIIATAVAAGAWLLRRSQGGLGLAPREKLAVGLGAFCGGMIGAKLPFALADWEGLLSGSVWFSDGKTILSGLVGAYFGVVIAKWSLDIRVGTGDALAAPAAVAIAIGRLGCFTGGCCYGTATQLPWGVVFPSAGPPAIARHPTQIYEALFHASMVWVLLDLKRRGVWRGQLAKFYILSYLLYRFLTEWIRPEARYWGGLTAYQWAAVLLVPVFAWLWWRDTRPESKEAACQAELQV